VLSGEATNTNFIVFGFTSSGLEPMIYHIRGEHAYPYATDAVHSNVLVSISYVITSICRNCIGQTFAQNEEKVLIARIINRYIS
jgi:hypothetical protein